MSYRFSEFMLKPTVVGKSVSALFLLLALTCAAQNANQNGRGMNAMSAEQSRQTEAAHRALLQVPITAEDRARLTARLRGAKSVRIHTAPIHHQNFIDDHIFGRIERDHVPHAPLCTDEEFLRRVMLDLTGVIPDAARVTAFIADARSDKRSRVIDELLNSEAYLNRWSYYFTALFHLGRGGLGAGVDLFHLWLREQFRVDRPFDEMVQEILTASGKNDSLGEPQFAYYLTNNVYEKEFVMQEDTDDERTITIFRDFLGMNISCISCHDGAGHVDKINLWLAGRTRRQFWQQSAFLGKTHTVLLRGPGGGQGAEFQINDWGPGYNMREHSIARPPRYGGDSAPAFLLTGESAKSRLDPRDELARILTSSPQFARATVNRFWAHFMTVGLVDPPDAFDLARLDPRRPPPKPWLLQPSDPELLEALAADFRTHGYSLRRLMRLIATSSAYQLSSEFDGEWRDAWATYYARKLARPLQAEELYDSIVKATGVADPIVKYSGAQNNIVGGSADQDHADKESQQKAGRLIELSSTDDLGGDDLKSLRYWLSAFGLRKQAPPSLLQPVLMMNHEVVKRRIGDKNGLIAKLFSADPNISPSKVIEALYLAVLSRLPRAEEVQLLKARMKGADPRTATEDIEWALLNKLEFLFNY
jgi:hypothetical protein